MIRPLSQLTAGCVCVLQEKERLSALEKRYHSLTGGKSFPKSSTAMREVRHTQHVLLLVLGSLTHRAVRPVETSTVVMCDET